jgi:hypothetical protein
MLTGERDFECLRTELQYDEAYIVRRILAALSGEPGSKKRASRQTRQRHSKKKPRAKRRA